jgi:hypothetical protein
MARIRAKAKAIDLRKQQMRITLAAASALFIVAVLLLIRP